MNFQNPGKWTKSGKIPFPGPEKDFFLELKPFLAFSPKIFSQGNGQILGKNLRMKITIFEENDQNRPLKVDQRGQTSILTKGMHVNSTKPSREVFTLSCFWRWKSRSSTFFQIGRSSTALLRRTNREFLLYRFPELFDRCSLLQRLWPAKIQILNVQNIQNTEFWGTKARARSGWIPLPVNQRSWNSRRLGSWAFQPHIVGWGPPWGEIGGKSFQFFESLVQVFLKIWKLKNSVTNRVFKTRFLKFGRYSGPREHPKTGTLGPGVWTYGPNSLPERADCLPKAMTCWSRSRYHPGPEHSQKLGWVIFEPFFGTKGSKMGQIWIILRGFWPFFLYFLDSANLD